MFDRFTHGAKRVVVLAQEEARMLDHNYIGTEHLLLAVLHEGTGTGARTLGNHGVTIEGARAAIVEMIGRGIIPPSGHIPFTPRARKALDQALKESLVLESNSITEDHILLGVLRGSGIGVAVQILQKLGAVKDTMLGEIEGHLTSAGPTEEDAGTPVAEALTAFQRALGADLDVPYSELKNAMTEALRAAQLAAVGLTRAA
ncbi:Clp protease N-terminal domain-containing protein [Arthrobacter caoxuetaonis]|uniref:Clp protease N-terminal domain-containing protein n=1 Tax=Arthrobacter caoxuetaonis TaxID=2886935 RepID=UPI0022B1E5A7|nr:Clp protease N-terminal domain-containing protein [Arthrobacter caoxuetaonis]